MPELLLMPLLFMAGVLAGVSNAIAGGGTFFTFPVLLMAGIPPVVANASNMIAVWPGNVIAIVAYRDRLKNNLQAVVPSILLVFIGGCFGAWLLLVIDSAAFVKLIPALIIFATALFAFGGKLAALLRRCFGGYANSKRQLIKRFFDALFAVYGGFFGAGYGIILLAWLQISDVHDMQTNNALKNLLSAVVSSVAVVIFVLSGQIAWAYTLIAFSGALLGGLLGALLARRLSAVWLSRVIVCFGTFLSGYYFVKYYG